MVELDCFDIDKIFQFFEIEKNYFLKVLTMVEQQIRQNRNTEVNSFSGNLFFFIAAKPLR